MELKYPEIWGGVECTYNRVGDIYFDQLLKNGHYNRSTDLELFSSLGIKKIRYPILWEKIAPDGIRKADWTWADERLEKLKELGIDPIVGFVHHGSGPLHTNLLSECFVEKFSEYAEAFARRYPWITYFTPINEPLTTARFSALYGHWYPHVKDDFSFVKALFAESRATIESMRRIKEIIPSARLIQTEDLGKVYSTPHLQYQAAFENDRRWLSLDLLTKKLTPKRRLWYYFTYLGIKEEEMEWFLDNSYPPDIIGINHYLTSERFLDENIGNYPLHTHGSNGKDKYADVEAIRVCAEGSAGHYHLLKEAWQRYEIPLALTEVHLNSGREGQLRWLKQAWDLSVLLLNEGVTIEAITAWSLLGSYDWCSLVTKQQGKYETGVFDVRNGFPRPTALADMIKQLSHRKTYSHPVTEIPGWWRRPSRLLYPPYSVENQNINTEPINPLLKNIYWEYFKIYSEEEHQSRINSTRPLMILGAGGTLGKAFTIICKERGIPFVAFSRSEVDITNQVALRDKIIEFNPWAVVNTAGYVRVDDAEIETELCSRINTQGAVLLSEICRDFEIQYIYFSTDLVFDGKKRKPYIETDAVAPLNFYGVSKARAEHEILQTYPNALIIRTSSFFGPWDNYNWISLALERISRYENYYMCNSQLFTATYVPDLVHATLDLLIDNEKGIWHLTSPGEVTWAEMAGKAARLIDLDSSLIRPQEKRSTVQKPSYSVLGSERGIMLPPLNEAMAHFCEVVKERFQKVTTT